MDEVVSGAGRTRSARIAVVAGVVIAVAAGLWSAAWVYARTRFDAEIETRLAALEARGVRIACSDRHVGGYPFMLEVACGDAGIEIAARGVAGSVSSMRAGASIFTPHRVSITLEGPLVGESGDGRISAKWRRLVVAIDWSEAGLERASLSGDDVDVTVAAIGRPDTVVRAAHLEAHGEPSGASGHDLAVAVSGAAASLAIGGRTLGPKRSDLGVSATLVDFLPPGPGAALPAFAGRGGKIEPIGVDFAVGGVTIVGKGAMVLGRDGVLDGSIGFAARGLEAIAAGSGGMDRETVGLLGAFVLLGKPSNDPALPGRRLDLVVEHGRPRFGRLVMAPIAPLFQP